MSGYKENEILKKIIANKEVLHQCKRHVFDTDATPDKKVAKRWQCSVCGGEVDDVAKHWYDLGTAHALLLSR